MEVSCDLLGHLSTIQKQNAERGVAHTKSPHQKTKLKWANPKSFGFCSFVSLIIIVFIFTIGVDSRGFCLQDRLSISMFSEKFSKGCKKNYSYETNHCECLDAASWQWTLPYAVNEFLAKRNIPVPQPSYSSDFSSCKYFSFQSLKKHLKRHHFEAIDSIKKYIMDQVKQSRVSEFQHCYEEWENCLKICVVSQRNYLKVIKYRYNLFVNECFYLIILIT